MKATRRPNLFVEQLEQRDCPTFVLRLIDGTLYLNGTPTPGTGEALRLLQTAPNQWEVIDGGGGGAAPVGGSNLGKYNVDSLNVNLTQHQGAPIIFDLGGFTSTGNITVNLGTGDNTNLANHGLTIYDGTLAGNVLILNGSGEERIQMGYLPLTNAVVAGATTIGGNVTIIAKENPGAMQGGFPVGNIFDTGTEPNFDPSAVAIDGSLTTVGVGAVQLANLTTVGGNVSQTMVKAQILSGGAGDEFWGTINGNLTVQGAPSSSGDFIQLGDGSGTDVAAVNGNLGINLGNGNNQLSFVGPFVIGGNTNIESGSGNSSISLGGTGAGGTQGGQYNGNLNVQLGNGNNTDGTTDPNFFNPGAAFLPASTTVNGSFTLTAGNGNNNLTTAGNPLAASIGGTTNITFGNGSDSVFTVGSTNLGGTFNWHSGNGNDSLAFAGAATAANYNVNITFGNGNDSLAFNDPAGSTFSGLANGGNGINSFFQAAGNTLVSPFQLINFG